jgi:hypothetical protein
VDEALTDDGREAMRRLARGAERICSMILDGELPAIDVDIAIGNLRDEAGQLFPDRAELFAMIYESRFQRLRQQFPRGLDIA